MAGQATELFNLASSFDPYGAFREGQMSAQKYDIEQAVLDEQTKEIEADKAASLAQQAGQPGQPVQLAKMANQMIPDAKLYNDDGTLTTAGQMNDMMVNANKLAKQSKIMAMQASLIKDPYQRTQATAEARRLGQTAQQDALKARELNDKVKNDSIYAAAMAKDQTQWDAAIQAYQDSGLPLPKGIPLEYSPENAKKIMSLAPAALQSKITNDQLKQKQEERLVKSAELRDQKMAASLRDGASGKGNGMRSAIIEQRQDTLAVNATEFVRTLQNITELPAESSSGMFGGKTAGSLFTAPLEAAANTLTTDSVQRYNSEMGGLGNHLAWMVSGGLSPSVSVQEKFDSILKIKEGDSQAAVLGKLARARQEAENVLAVKMKSRLMSPEMKEMLKGLDDDLKKTIPFTVKDVNTWANAKDKKETFREFMGKTIGGETVTVGGKTYTRPSNMSDQDWADYKASVGASK